MKEIIMPSNKNCLCRFIPVLILATLLLPAIHAVGAVSSTVVLDSAWLDGINGVIFTGVSNLDCSGYCAVPFPGFLPAREFLTAKNSFHP